MPLYDLHRILGMCAKMSCRAILTYFGIALVFSVSVSIGRTVCKRMVLRTNDAIVILIVFVLPPFVSAVHCLRSFVCRTENTIVIKYLFANMGSFVSTVCYNGFYLGKPFGHFFIYVIKCYAIMYVAGSYYGFQLYIRAYHMRCVLRMRIVFCGRLLRKVRCRGQLHFG